MGACHKDTTETLMGQEDESAFRGDAGGVFQAQGKPHKVFYEGDCELPSHMLVLREE